MIPSASRQARAPVRAALPALERGAERLGYPLDERQQELFVRYAEFLLKANEKVNLTALRSPEQIMTGLFLDSVALSMAIPPEFANTGQPTRVIDVGSGAGVPGVPLKILFPEWSVALVESIGKKARFLGALIAHLRLARVTVEARRAEDLGWDRTYRDQAHLCCARAIGALPTVLELCAPLTAPGGMLLFPRSGNVDEEVTQAKESERALRTELVDVVPVPIDLGLGSGRATVRYRKIGPTPAQFPRRVGVAKAQPLGTPAARVAEARGERSSRG